MSDETTDKDEKSIKPKKEIEINWEVSELRYSTNLTEHVEYETEEATHLWWQYSRCWDRLQDREEEIGTISSLQPFPREMKSTSIVLDHGKEKGSMTNKAQQ